MPVSGTHTSAEFASETEYVYLLGRSSVVITTVNLFTDDGEVALRRVERIGLPRKADGWDLNNRLRLARRAGAREPEMFGGVLVLHWFAG